ncbi:uncharacterized protein CLUP02_06980 [Colletotrichum lupini]|uniref:Uncharacterized protein n=1 Tax=Colletotrichum lupini TaxID=145971 RepID=A0A9Q8SQ50_9PEZI|nr:uncharacterized protein CLUP02_06980 [Colletotrichum lupini]UQC81494.1 hypothetical protein CLUP02_06980 [Colletotrichum lupini]
MRKGESQRSAGDVCIAAWSIQSGPKTHVRVHTPFIRSKAVLWLKSFQCGTICITVNSYHQRQGLRSGCAGGTLSKPIRNFGSEEAAWRRLLSKIEWGVPCKVLIVDVGLARPLIPMSRHRLTVTLSSAPRTHPKLCRVTTCTGLDIQPSEIWNSGVQHFSYHCPSDNIAKQNGALCVEQGIALFEVPLRRQPRVAHVEFGFPGMGPGFSAALEKNSRIHLTLGNRTLIYRESPGDARYRLPPPLTNFNTRAVIVNSSAIRPRPEPGVREHPPHAGSWNFADGWGSPWIIITTNYGGKLGTSALSPHRPRNDDGGA